MKQEIAQKILQENVTGYNRIARHFSQTRKFPWSDFKFFKQYINMGNDVLDAGCGSGRLYEFLADQNINYSGIDSSQELINIAQKNYPQANFSVGDITNLPFSDNKFNAIYCIATLHHIPGQKFRQQAVKEFSRVLKPNGYLILTNWNLCNLNWWPTHLIFSLKKILGQNNLDWKDIQKPWKNPQGETQANRYLHAFTKCEMKKLLHKNGFQIVKQFYTKKDLTTNKFLGFNLVTIAIKT